MFAVIDTNFFINGKIHEHKYEHAFITTKILEEIRDNNTRSLYNLNSFRIEIRDPHENFTMKVTKYAEEKNLLLSDADISFVALCLEIQESLFDMWISSSSTGLMGLSDDSDVLRALSHFNIPSNREVNPSSYIFRCYGCFKLYENRKDFCDMCGYPTITRVRVSKEGDKTILHLKKNYKPTRKIIRDERGREIKSADSKEYYCLLKKKERKQRKINKMISGYEFD